MHVITHWLTQPEGFTDTGARLTKVG